MASRSAVTGTPADWVPAGAWLVPGYAEWPAPAPLRDAVACLWARIVPPDGVPGGRAGPADSGPARSDILVLPDACCDLIWEQGRGAYVAGPDTSPSWTRSVPGTTLVGVRFRPAAGGPALGLPLSEIRDQRAGLAELLPATAKGLLAGVRGLPADAGPADAAARARDLAGRLVAARELDRAVVRAAALLRDPSARAEDVAAGVGLSPRQLRRRCHAAAGYGPKTLQRVLRFRRFVGRVDSSAGLPDLATLAAETGYADQAHLTRECAALSGLTPVALARVRRGTRLVSAGRGAVVSRQLYP